MIVGTCGFGSTGSSAVTDYLKEFNTFQVLDNFEFTWVSAVDGLIDLDFHINNPHNRTTDSICAIERFKKLCEDEAYVFQSFGIPKDVYLKNINEFLDSIITTSWKWNPPKLNHPSIFERILLRIIQKYKIITKWEVKHGRQWEGFPYKDVYLSVKPQDFDGKAKKLVMSMFEATGADLSKPIALDQPFPGNNPQACFKYYEDPYAIVVDRDPRDNYTFGRTKLLQKSFCHLMPTNSVEDYIKYYRAIRENQPYKEKNNRVLAIQFEDMIYHYDETTEKIRDFLKLGDNPAPKSIFDPAISMPNTQVWKRYPQFAKDIKRIEEELPEYLFDYTGCPEPDPNGEMFVGKSPKNK